MCLVSPVGRSRTACGLVSCGPVALCPCGLVSCGLVSCGLVSCGLVSCDLVSCGLVSCVLWPCVLWPCVLWTCGLVSCGLVSCGLVALCPVALYPALIPLRFPCSPTNWPRASSISFRDSEWVSSVIPSREAVFLDLSEPLSETKIVTNKRLYQLLLNVNYSNLEYVLIVKQIVHCV